MKLYKNVTQVGNYIYHRYIDDDGKTKEEYTDLVDVDLFVPTTNQTRFKSYTGENLKRMSFCTIRDAKEFLKEHSDISNMKVHGNRNWWAQFISKNYPGEIKWKPSDITVCNIDIETKIRWDDGTIAFPDPEKAPSKITAITYEIDGNYTVFGLKPYNVHDNNVTYHHCANEEELLLTFIDEFSKIKIDMLTGWNIMYFDIPYLVNRITKILGHSVLCRLAPAHRFLKDRAVRTWENTRDGKSYKNYYIHGLVFADMLELYKNYTFKEQERYSLDFIAKVELGEEKLDYSEYDNLDDLYEKDHQKYIDYNIHDVRLVKRINEKRNLIPLALSLTYQAKIRLDDHFSQVRMWDTLIYNRLIENDVAVPPMSNADKFDKYTGAIVFDPQVGMHEWIVSADLNSLYPSTIRWANISPEKLVTREKLQEINNEYSNVLLDRFDLYTDKLTVSVDSFVDQSEDEKLMTACKELNFSLAANGVLYSRDSQGFLPQLMEEIYEKRSEMKNHMLDSERELERIKSELTNPGTIAEFSDRTKEELLSYKNEISNDIAIYNTMQISYKTLLNSAYGALGNSHFRFYNVDMAESITISGQLSIQWIQKRVNAYLNKLLKTDKNYIIAGDTDSFYMTLAEFVKRITKGKTVSKDKIVDLIDEFFEDRIQPVIDSSYTELAEYMNAFDQQMIMKREVIADRGFWRAKKNYALNVYDSEHVRYETPKLKIMGIEAIKSSTPEICRDALKESIRLVLQETEESLQKYAKKFKKEFYDASIEVIASPRGISDIDKWKFQDDYLFKKKTPIHVKGSISYNRLIDRYQLDGKYHRINNGDKIKFVPLQQPNVLHSNVIAFPDELPPEFDLDRYVDYGLQYKNTYVQAIESILTPIGWSLEKRGTLF